MESLPIFCSSLPCHRFGGVSFKSSDRDLGSRSSSHLVHRKAGILCAGARPIWIPEVLGQGNCMAKNIQERDGLRLPDISERHSNRGAATVCVAVGNVDGYVTGRDASLQGLSRKVDERGKVLIPGLPDDSGGNQGSPINSCFWEWRPKLSVHYEKSGSENVNAPALLFLPGFGVGSFHYEKQLKDLGREYRVWALDFLGQGMSLPSEDPAPSDGRNMVWGFGEESEPWAHKLVYSVDLWRDQVQNFVEEVIGEPVYVVGNSLGGFVALYFAARNPQLVKGVTLLNATPFWGFLPNPIRSPALSKIFPWAGTFPLPASVRTITEIVWQKISDPSSIEEVLKQVYVDHSTKVDKVFSRIIETTEHPAAAASFASIMFAPQGELSFDEALSSCQMQGIPICLVYGKEDPWVRPFWGLRVKQQLPETPYYEISPAGHCPHDEVPEVVNYLLRGWIKNLESRGSSILPLLDESTNAGISRELEYIKEGSRKSVQVRFRGSGFSVWNELIYVLKTWFANTKLASR